MSRRSHDVAIYRPAARPWYDTERTPRGGGAELQTVLLARGLAAEGFRVAQIVWPPSGGIEATPANLDVITRAEYAGKRGLGGPVEAWAIWRSLAQADAQVYVIRGGGPQLLIASIFCAVRNRKLLFSASIDLDFDLERPDRSRTHLELHRLGLRGADVFVCQTEKQGDLARRLASDGTRVEVIPSFAEAAEAADPDRSGFLWVGRLVTYKQPLELIRMAAALPESRFRMVFLETVESGALAADVERAAAELPNVELLGQRARSEVLELISRSAALVSTSASEGMPNVFLEAWARGVPVLSLEFGAGSLITQRGLGVVGRGSLKPLVEAAARIEADDAVKERFASACRAYVSEVHSPRVVAERWANLLRSLLDGSASDAEP